MDDTELERLLTQLLRVVSPAPAGDLSPSSLAVSAAVAGLAAAAAGRAAPGAAGAAATSTVAGGPVAGGPVAGGPVVDGPVVGDPVVGDPVAGGPVVGGAVVAEPVAGGAVAGDAVVGERVAGDRAAGAEPGIPSVSPSEARALIELVSARGIAQGELAGLLGLEKSTVSRLAAGLERKGWIRRGRDEENQRYVRLYLTPDGRAIAGRVWAAWQSRQARILGALSAEERAGLSAGLRGLMRGLTAEGLLGEVPGHE
jgi:DNA-binding MarR family transcriptional regulator